MSTTFYGGLTSIPKNGSIYQIMHILISPFIYKRILKTTAPTTESVNKVSEDYILTSFWATVNETKIDVTKNLYRKHIRAYFVNRQLFLMMMIL